MRKVKFRAWEARVKKYIDWDNFINNPFGTWGMKAFNNDRYHFQQYTGLKDKNGKEIFEGDVLEDKWGYRFSVFFEDGCYKTDSEDFEKVNERQINYHNLKVIGNVYENPELLGDSQ